MEKINLKQYQKELIKIYKDVKIVFDSFNIKLIANSGTLLGLIRNRDLIPWDDDLDFLVCFRDYKNNYKDIKKKVEESGELYLLDFIQNEENLPGNLIMARVYKRKKFVVEYNNRNTIARPFIDIFFLLPSTAFNTEKKWIRYSRLHQMRWITRKGFKRYLSDNDKPTLVLWKNVITLPSKIVYWNKLHNYRIFKPYNKNFEDKDWLKLKRADGWAFRNVVYDLERIDTIRVKGVDFYINSNYNEELLISYGPSWKSEIETIPHIFSREHTKHLRNIKINDFFNQLDND